VTGAPLGRPPLRPSTKRRSPITPRPAGWPGYSWSPRGGSVGSASASSCTSRTANR
jgi:hypothetical protein